MLLIARLTGAAIVALALLATGRGIWLLTTPDYQGGRDLAGVLTLVIGSALGFLGLGLLVLTRRA